MSLSPGTKLGSYEIVSPLGACGMGEVYRARDTRLGREVALKVLPTALASGPERMARFQREAQVLASRNHPQIGAIYGFEVSGGVRHRLRAHRSPELARPCSPSGRLRPDRRRQIIRHPNALRHYLNKPHQM